MQSGKTARKRTDSHPEPSLACNSLCKPSQHWSPCEILSSLPVSYQHYRNVPLCPAEQKSFSDSVKHQKGLKGTSQFCFVSQLVNVCFYFLLLFFLMNICILIREEKKGCSNRVNLVGIGGGDCLIGIYYIQIYIMNIDK